MHAPSKMISGAFYDHNYLKENAYIRSIKKIILTEECSFMSHADAKSLSLGFSPRYKVSSIRNTSSMLGFSISLCCASGVVGTLSLWWVGVGAI